MIIFKRIKKLFKPSKYSKKIFIENWGFENRGDQLMIISVMEQIRKYEPNAQILVRRNVFEQDPSYCIKNNLYPLELNNTGFRCSRLYSWIINAMLGDEWINTPRQIDLILNCRGYYIADIWIKNDDFVYSLESFYKQFNKKGRRLIMLPQAFGPFTNEASRKSMDFIYKQANLIFAREQQSYDYLKEVYSNMEKVEIAPDFTCLLSPEEKPTVLLPEKGYVLIIPNSRMMDKTDKKTSDSYLNFLVQVIDFLLKRGESVYLLNHEGTDDEELCYILSEKFNNQLPILTRLSGMEIKSIIRRSKLLMSARYHGVVSGLTQGVPTLCTSWSHKYGELLQEHGCSNNILDVVDVGKSKCIIEDALVNPEAYSSRVGCEEEIEKKVTNMWNEIFNNIAGVI